MSATSLLLDPGLAINSVLVWLLGAILFSAMAWSLFQRGFIRNTYLSDTSSLRFILHRTRLLFLLSCLGIVDALNNASFHYLVWQFNKYPVNYFWVHRSIIALVFPWLLPMGVLALSYRCASVITSNQRWRDRYILCATAICIVAGTLQVTSGFTMILAQKDQAPAIQISPLTRWFTPWGNYSQIVLPLLAIIGSTLSIQKVATQRRKNHARGLPTMLLSWLRPKQSQTDAGQQPPSCPLAIAGTPISSATTHDSCTASASFNQNDSHPGDGPIAGTSSTNVATTKGKLLSPPAIPTVSVASAARVKASYPLTLSFQALNVLVLINWTASGLLTSIQIAGQVRIQAWLSVLVAVSVASEASFERLTKYYNRRRGAKAAAAQSAKYQDADGTESMFRGVATVAGQVDVAEDAMVGRADVKSAGIVSIVEETDSSFS
ncbi:hypothetical protein BCR44DRAFT_1431791 [Catenaria anguillulae PL171]|uniref:Uncharacterized protein n=1 Tax=Catenaria anguillulae PL171 TaxID=765915 RepID=A0A1Y2HQB1_9FUNG|nr:hypothetical protein BCR44DRAFT_1431791 [Catenaria anguillulae PL171]